jgi:photosystem II stability/assembly factor-like uncharacterized protein
MNGVSMKTVFSVCFAASFAVSMSFSSWTWMNPYPAGNTLNAVATDGSGTWIMAGEGGHLLQWDGNTFTAPVFDTQEQVHALAMTADGAGVAACERADVLISMNGEWQVNRPQSAAWFYGAAVSPGGDIWVCGDLGEIHRYRDDAWEQTPSATTSTLKSIDMISDDRGWAVGLFGTARVWNGTSWQHYSSQTSRFLRSVSGFSVDCAWAVGDLGTIIRWTGTGFVPETSGVTRNLYDVAAVNETDAWAVGDSGTVLRRTESGWEDYTDPLLPDDVSFRSIALAGPDNVMIAGMNGAMFYYDGENWTGLRRDMLDGADAHTIHVVSAGGDVLIGTSAGAIFSCADGVFEQQFTWAEGAVRVIREDGGGLLWAGGDIGGLFQRSGDEWTDFPTGDTEDIYDIDFTVDGDIWTAGGTNDAGCVSWAVLHYDGSIWTKYGESGT